MKKSLFLIFSLACMFLLTSCSASAADTGNEKEAFSDLELAKWGESDRAVYYTLDDLEKSSDAVIVGSFTEDAVQEEEYEYSDHFGKEILTNIRSFNTVEVKSVLKGSVKEGEKLKISQSYGVHDGQLLTISDLTPMAKGDTWIFFLSTADDADFYWCTGDCDGRYPVKDFAYQRNALTENEDLGVFDKEDFNEEIYNEILEKYEF